MSLSPETIATSTLCVIAAMIPELALSDTVNIRAADGTMTIVGELVDFRDDTYLLNTKLGPLHLKAGRVSCEGKACPTFETGAANVVISGSESIASGAIPLLLSGYAEHLNAEITSKVASVNGEVIATLETGGSSSMTNYLVAPNSGHASFQNLLNGTADIALTTRRMGDLSSHGDGDTGFDTLEHVIGIDNLAVITHPDNPVTTLALWQLRDIYSGKITNWSELGGKDLPITVVARQEASGTRALFENRLFANQRTRALTEAVIAVDGNAVASEVNTNRSAIGYVSHAFTRGAKTLTLVNECGFKTKPDIFSAKTEEYPFQQRLYMYADAEKPSENVSGFLTYAASAKAQAMLARAGFADLGVQSKLQSPDSIRARLLRTPSNNPFEGVAKKDMLSQMVNYQRLSSTFRFSAQGALDERAEHDMAQLKEFLKRQPYGARVMFVGFTDNMGPFESSRAQSIKNAKYVMSAFEEFAGRAALDGLDLTSTGYGAIAPTACNTTEQGRAVNRRVEVWVSKATS